MMFGFCAVRLVAKVITILKKKGLNLSGLFNKGFFIILFDFNFLESCECKLHPVLLAESPLYAHSTLGSFAGPVAISGDSGTARRVPA